MTSLPTGTVTFLFTDIEESTRLLRQLGDHYADVLAEYRRLLRVVCHEQRGKEVDTQGDACFVAFLSARNALTAAVAAQRAINVHGWPEGVSLRVRMGLHTGEALAAETGYVGMDVHRAARICAAGHGGQILLSQTTRDIIEERPLEGLTLRDLGEHRLKDLGQAQHLYQVILPDVPADFPPLKTLDALPHNLPIQLTSFIGREREMTEIKALLRSTRLLTLTGSGGCGKTRLAVQVAADVLELFRDGVWFVDLVPLSDPTIVPHAVASALGVREAPGHPLLVTLAEYLRDRRVLLVLDNCEHLVVACAQLAEALLRSCPYLRILATSREAVGIEGELTFRVPSLSVPDLQRLPALEQLIDHEAVRLFTERARWSLPAFAVTSQNADAVAQVCVQLDGMPLAIEMAAARVKVLTVEQIATRLDDRFRLLRAGSRTALPRHQTLRAAMDWSYDLLPEKERGILRRTSVFAGGWTLEAAESICAGDDVEAADVLDLLTRLVDRSLVIAEPHGGEVRYRLLETVRQYGRQRLRESGETAQTHRRHRDWYLQFAELAEPKLRRAEQDLWVSRLEVEHDNLRAALAWSVADIQGAEVGAPAKADRGLRLVGAMWWFWFIGGYFSEGGRWLEQMLAASEGASPAWRGRALLGRGVLTFMLGDFRGGTALLEESLHLARAADDRRGMAWATGWLGVPALYAGDNERAETQFQESLALWRQLGDAWGIAWMAQGLGNVDESLVLCREVGDKWLTGLTLLSSATGALARKDMEKATVHIEESLTLFRQLRDRRGTARALGILGQIARVRGDDDRAAALFRESLALFQEIGDKRGIALCFERLGSAACVQGRLEQAARLFGAVDAVREAIGVAAGDRAAVRLETGESGRAVDELSWGVAAYELRGAGDRAALRTEMGDDAFEAAWAEGRAMTLEQAIEYALSDT